MLVDFRLSSSPNVPGTPGGTVGYVAPEVAAGGRPSRASDIYALAATGWALLTGEPPSARSRTGRDRPGRGGGHGGCPSGRARNTSGSQAGDSRELVQAAPRRLGFRCRRVSSPSALSDIEASTALWEHHPGAMGRALLRHDELIATAVESHGGRFLKSMGEGDSTFFVFDSATQATHATGRPCGSWSAEQWPDGLTIRVQFGLHTGEAERRGAATSARPLPSPHACEHRPMASPGLRLLQAAKLVERSLPATSSSSTSGRTGFAASIRRRTYSPSTARGSTRRDRCRSAPTADCCRSRPRITTCSSGEDVVQTALGVAGARPAAGRRRPVRR